MKPSIVILAAAVLAGCSGTDRGTAPAAAPGASAARPGRLANCEALASSFHASDISIAVAAPQPEGSVHSRADGIDIALPAHCLVQGQTANRTGLDGKTYAIHFEMRLPVEWNGRFFHQVNGGSDGDIQTDGTRAFGRKLGGSPASNGLREGFAVLTSDAGHAPDASLPTDPATGLDVRGQAFGLDPQARIDYGYGAVARMTPVAKALIAAAYGRPPDRSYIVGCSNGGRHAMVAAARFARDYDGVLAGDPGFDLPKAAVAEMFDNQQLMSIATATDSVTGRPAIASAFGKAELSLVASRVLARCDALDGLADGMVNDLQACRAAFSIARDVPTCAAGTAPGASCLSAAQKTVLQRILGGATDSRGQALYAGWPADPGIGAPGWRIWKMGEGSGTGIARYGLNLALGTPSMQLIFKTPPASTAQFSGQGGALIDAVLGFDLDRANALINATDGAFGESSMGFMTPQHPADLSALRDRGGKLIVFHGTADPVFSIDDTLAWYAALTAANGGDATAFARVFAVPGMNHCSGGPATDQFDFLKPLVNWVEQGVPPDRVVATSRPLAQNNGAGGIPPGRTRPLCAWPKKAVYDGAGSPEIAASFSCR